MKELLQQIIRFTQAHFNWKLFASVLVFILLCVALNYGFSLYKDYIYHTPDKLLKGFKNALLLGVPFLVVCLFISLFTDHKEFWRHLGFWARILVFFGIWNVSYAWDPLDFLKPGLTGHAFIFVSRTVNRLESMVNVVLPLVVAYFLFERESYKSMYGIRSTHWDWKPYLILFLLLVVTIGLGSFFNDLRAYYPRYLLTQGGEYAATSGFDEWILVAIYELAYGSDFISIELFFRGALVLAFYRYLGGYVVLAMVASYVCLHFGKPLTEALSSAVGGYVLGVIALHSRNIWGGVVLHVGVAWLMEFYGWLQRVYN